MGSIRCSLLDMLYPLGAIRQPLSVERYQFSAIRRALSDGLHRCWRLSTVTRDAGAAGGSHRKDERTEAANWAVQRRPGEAPGHRAGAAAETHPVRGAVRHTRGRRQSQRVRHPLAAERQQNGARSYSGVGVAFEVCISFVVVTQIHRARCLFPSSQEQLITERE